MFNFEHEILRILRENTLTLINLEMNMSQTVTQLAADATTLAHTNDTLLAAYLALKNSIPSGTVLSAEDQAAVDAADALVNASVASDAAALQPAA